MRKRISVVLVLMMVLSIFSVSFADSTYTVEQGDTLANIANMYDGVTWKDIVDANDLADPNLIIAGDKLVIPMNGKLVILHTNDTHSRVEAGKYAGMGFAKIGTTVEMYREKYDNVLVLDAGDTFHGQTISQLNEGKSIVDVMNTIGYDAMTAGNHDFNYGYERLKELNEMTNFPVLVANVKDSNGMSVFEESRIIYKDGLKIGLFGLATPETMYKTHPKNVEGLIFEDPAVAAKEVVTELKDKTDIIIAIAHLGIDESTMEKYTSKYLAENVEGIDIIIDGHSHTMLGEGMMVNDTLIAQAGEYDKNLGIIEVEYKDNMIMKKQASLLNKSEADDIMEHKDVLNAVADTKAENEVITSVVIGSVDKVLDGERAQVRTGQTNLGNLITKSMLEKTGADVAITNGGGIRASIQPGKVTKGDVITVLPFGNYVIVKEVTGQAIWDAVEHGIQSYPNAEGYFPHIGGMTVKFDSSLDGGSRVQSIMIGDKEIDLEMTYSLATNDFMAAGGDDYSMFKGTKTLNEYGGLDEILIDWISSNGTEGAMTDDRLMDISK